MLTAATYLDELNPEQRRAVEHGVRQDCTVGPPLLVIAGAGHFVREMRKLIMLSCVSIFD